MDNKTLAKMAGYYAKTYEQDPGGIPGWGVHILYNPKGTPIARLPDMGGNIGNQHHIWDDAPDFLGSVDAALTLIPPGVEWYLHCVDMRRVHDTEWFQKGDSPIIRYWAAIEDLLAECEDSRYTETPEEAICRAWMAYMQKETQNG
jgi:hypothetical protein